VPDEEPDDDAPLDVPDVEPPLDDEVLAPVESGPLSGLPLDPLDEQPQNDAADVVTAMAETSKKPVRIRMEFHSSNRWHYRANVP
jgi:hypothetical protein